ncbi:MAG: hypothetical protein H6818_17290 [Phycisphaerales bacterium]|nr:hypothetical protein [Phycisphaerales bacterium]
MCNGCGEENDEEEDAGSKNDEQEEVISIQRTDNIEKADETSHSGGGQENVDQDEKNRGKGSDSEENDEVSPQENDHQD